MLVGSTRGWKEDFECDDIPKFIEIAERYKLWCHVEGCRIFTLAVTSASSLPDQAQKIQNAIMQADSILFNALTLLGYTDKNKKAKFF